MTYQELRREWENRGDLKEKAEHLLEQEKRKVVVHSSLPDIIEKSKNIHAGFFFEPKWRNVLMIFCQKICSTPKNSQGGWDDLANKLHLSNGQINPIKYRNVPIQQDGAFIVLLAYAQNKEATVCEVFNSLNEMKRYDIIDALSTLVMDLCDSINTTNCVSQDGEYHSQENDSNSIVKPGKQIEAPLILHSIAVDADDVKTESCNITSESFQRSQPPLTSKSKIANPYLEKAYSFTVMLTFADDGEKAAMELATALRNSFDKKQQSIGVVILAENKPLIVDDALMNILECFNQVDFVLPIITKNYTHLVFSSLKNLGTSRGSARDVSPILEPDHYFAPLIFRLMCTEYTRQHCRNVRFRSVIPEEHLLFLNHSIMNVPFLSLWCILKDAVESPRRALFLKKNKKRVD